MIPVFPKKSRKKVFKWKGGVERWKVVDMSKFKVGPSYKIVNIIEEVIRMVCQRALDN